MPIEDLIFNFLDENFTNGEARIKYYNEVRNLADNITKMMCDEGEIKEQLEENENEIHALKEEVDSLEATLSNVVSILETIKDKVDEAINEAE